MNRRHLSLAIWSPPTSSEARRLLAERLRELDAFVADQGLDYWESEHQLPLELVAA